MAKRPDAQEIHKLVKAGGSESEVGRRMMESHPDFFGGYVLVGQFHLNQGDLEAGWTHLWRAVEVAPCQPIVWFALAGAVEKARSGSSLAANVTALAMWSAALAERIPKALMDLLGSNSQKAFPWDNRDLLTACAIAADVKVRDANLEESEEEERLLAPHRWLREFREAAPSLLSSGLVSSGEEHLGLVTAVVRQELDFPGCLHPKALAFLVALIGEFGDAGCLRLLLEFCAHSDFMILLHANWALWRMVRRFPEESLEALALAAGTMPVAARCAIAEQLSLLDPGTPVRAVTDALVADLPAICREDDAAYLVVATAHALRLHGDSKAAEDLMAAARSIMGRKAKKELLRLDSPDSPFMPRLVAEDVAGGTIEDVCVDRIFMDDLDDGEDDEGDLFDGDDDNELMEAIAAEEQAPRAGLSRTDPCWCGSGRKYKNCHLPEDSEAAAAGQREEEPSAGLGRGRIANQVTDDLLRFCMKFLSKTELTRAHDKFFGSMYIHTGEEDTVPFTEWLLSDFRHSSSGHSIIEEYVRREGHRLSLEERKILDSRRSARYGLYQVTGVEEERGVTLRDTFQDETFFVHDVSGSRSLTKWDHVLARVETLDGENYFSASLQIVPATLLARLRQWLDEESARQGLTPLYCLRQNSHRMNRLVSQWHSEQPLPQLQNFEGDALVFSRAVYDVLDEAAVVAALEAQPGLESESTPAEIEFAWLGPGPSDAPRRSYGRIAIKGGRLTLEANSRERLAEGRALIESATGAAVKHRRDRFETVEAVMKRAARSPKPPPQPEIPRDVAMKLESEAKERHYATWPDHPLPALDGQSPRDAVKTAAGREKVRDLLRTFENGELRSRKEGRAWYDVNRLRTALGLERE